MTKARDIASAAPAPSTVSATEIGYLDGVTSAVQTQIDSKEPTLPSQTGNSGKYLTTNGSTKSWGTVSQYSLPSQTGNSGKYLTTNGTTESWGSPVKTFSIFGQTTSATVSALAWNGSNIYVAGFFSGALYSSTDSGVTWTSRTSGFSSDSIYAITYGNGIFVAVGGSGKITTSTDGITWTARTAGVSTNTLNNVRYLNSVFIAVGNGANGGTGGITTSTDGITWTKRNTPSGSSTELYDVAYGNGYYVATGDQNTKNGYYSTNLSTWTVSTTNNNQGIATIFYNGYFLTFSTSGDGCYSSNPSSSWTAISNSKAPIYAPYSTALYGVHNGKLYFSSSFYNDAIYGYELTLYGNNLTSPLTPIPLPVRLQGSGTGDKNAFLRSLLVCSDGVMLYGDDAGRIYKSN